MEQIDVLQYEKELKKDRIIRLAKNHKSLTSALVALTNFTCASITDQAFIRALLCFTAGMQISILKRYWNQEKIKEEEKIIEMLRTTTTYKELCDEYDNFIKDIAQLIRSTGLKSSKEISLYLQMLMEAGIFTYQQNHKYKRFENEQDNLIELLGAKVTTGRCVCRHMSSFFVDVLSELGFTAANISGTITNNDPVQKIKRGNMALNHAVTGIVEHGSKYLFDPTGGCFIALPQNFDFTEEESIHVSQFVIKDVQKYFIMSSNLGILNRNKEEEARIINTTKLTTITDGEVEYLTNKINLVFKNNMGNQFFFHIGHDSQKERIAKLYQELMPYGDQKIKQHIVRK